MTATLERWWTPEGEVGVHRLLRPGTDPQKDLGMGLLALHKAGAEACTLVAKTAVADEHVLIAALAETRQLVAGQAIQTISKAVGGPEYAGLLLKDVLDDAEVAALALYRTCLAKSVAPPIAAERVGMVYGVPSRELSRYASVASDPKSNPRAVQDLADRTLFDYVSKVVADEYVPVKETFSKEVLDYHGREPGERDEGGRFAVKTGTRPKKASLEELFAAAEQAKKEQALTPEVGTPAPDGAAPSRVGSREMRARRAMRQQRAERAAAAAAAARQPQSMSGQQLKARTMQGQSLKGKSLLGQQLSGEELAGHLLVKPFSPLPMAGMPRDAGDVLSRIDADRVSLDKLEPAVSFLLPADEYLELGRAAGDVPEGHILRLGHLERYAGGARIYERGGNTTADHEDTVELVKRQIEKAEDYKHQADFKVGRVSLASIVAPYGQLLSPQEQELELKKAKSVFLERDMGVPKELVATELSYVEHSIDKGDSAMMALVYRPPSRHPETDKMVTRAPAANVVEIIVKPGQVGGRVEQNGRVHLNPNDGIVMATLYSTTIDPLAPVSRRTYWDDSLQAFRTEITVMGTSEEAVSDAKQRKFKKNLSKADNPGTPYWDHREGGRFAVLNRPDVAPKPTLEELFAAAQQSRAAVPATTTRKTPVRMARLQRQQRQQRAAAGAKPKDQLAGQQLKPKTLGEQKLEGRALSRQLPLKALAGQRLDKPKPTGRSGRPERESEGVLDLSFPAQYSVIAPPAMEKILRDSSQEKLYPEDWVNPTELKKESIVGLQSYIPTHGEAAEIDLDDQAIGYWGLLRAAHGKGRLDYAHDVPLASATIEDVGGLEGMASRLMHIMETQPMISMLRLDARQQTDGMFKVTVFGNHEHLPTLHVIRYNEDADPERPKRLVPDKVRRRQTERSLYNELQLAFYRYANDPDMQAQPEIANPYVKTWTVE